MRSNRPTYTKWSRKTGGTKTCPKCRHRHSEAMRIDGKTIRPKACVKCGTELPKKLTYPRKGVVKWFVREFNPTTGEQKDHACRSSEHADEFIRQKERDYTPDPLQEKLIEYASTLIRQIEAETLDDGISKLIVKLGGDASALTLKPVEWNEAIDIVCDELEQKGRSDAYLADMRRVTADFRTVTGLGQWAEVDLDAIAKYRSVRMKGGWKRDGRIVKAVGGRAINKDLSTLSAFLSCAARKGWVKTNALKGAADEKVKVPAVRVDYMPDEDLALLVEAASDTWMRAFVIGAYYTGARRGDLLRLEWERDTDLDGTKGVAEARIGPQIYIRGNKADTPHWMPVHPAAVKALEQLRRHPIIDKKLFPVRESTNPASRVSQMFAQLCIKAGLTKTVERDGESVVKNKWTLHDLRRKANTDLRNRGASPKERAALLGHRCTVVNESYYEAVLPNRERELIDGLPTFGVDTKTA